VPLCVVVGLGLAVLVISLVTHAQISFTNAYENNITNIETSTQQSSGVTTSNYVPLLAEGVDWASLSDADRAGTARYAVNEAIAKAKADGVTRYNVLGMTSTDRQVIFLYTGGGDTVTISVNGEYTSIPLSG